MRGTEGTAAVAAAVRGQMGRYGLKQIDLAGILQMSQAGISRKLHGDIPFTVAELYDLADALDLEVTDLLPKEPAPSLAGRLGRRRLRQSAGWGFFRSGDATLTPV